MCVVESAAALCSKHIYGGAALRAGRQRGSRESGRGRRAVHLTNDAIQKTGPGYGAFEEANKLSMAQLQAALAERVRVRASGSDGWWQQSFEKRVLRVHAPWQGSDRPRNAKARL